MNDNQFLLADRIQKIQSIFEQYGIDNFYISYSGGKDSNVVDKLIDLAVPDNHIPRVFMRTGIELNAVVDFVLDKAKHDYRVHTIEPQINIKEYLKKNGYPFKSKVHAKRFFTFWNSGMTKSVKKYITLDPHMRYACPEKLRYQFTQEFLDSTDLRFSHWCCYGMKEMPLLKWKRQMNFKYTITGMRQAEGGQRGNVKCLAYAKNELRSFNPIAPCSDDWMNWIVKEYNIALPIVYYPPYNFQRTGCKGCPFAWHLQEELDILEKYFPEERKQCEYIFGPVYDEYRRINYRLKGENV